MKWYRVLVSCKDCVVCTGSSPVDPEHTEGSNIRERRERREWHKWQEGHTGHEGHKGHKRFDRNVTGTIPSIKSRFSAHHSITREIKRGRLVPPTILPFATRTIAQRSGFFWPPA